MMEERLVERLLESPTSAIAGDRQHWNDRPEGELLPALVFFVIDADHSYTHDDTVDLQYPRISFDCLGNTYSEAKLLSRALFSELNLKHIYDDIVFEEGICVLDKDMDKETLEGGTEIFRVTMDFMVPHRPPNIEGT